MRQSHLAAARRTAFLGCASLAVLSAAVAPSHAEEQIFNFFVNGGGFYDNTGAVPAATGGTGCCYSYVGPAQSGTPGHLSTPINTHHAVTFQTTSSGNGAISEASNHNNIGTKGHAVVGHVANDAYDGFGGVGLLGQSNFGGLTVNRRTEVTHGPTNAVTTKITNAFTNAGVPNAARFVETITNNTAATISGKFGFFNNLGSDSNTLFVATNNGALAPASPHSATGNLWLTSVQSTGGSDPVITHILGNNKYTNTQVLAAGPDGTGVYANGSDRPAFVYPISVAPGKTVTIVLIEVLTASINYDSTSPATMAPDIALGGQLANLIINNGKPLPINSPFFVGLTRDQIMSIINFDFITSFVLNGATVNQTNVGNALNAFIAAGGDTTSIAGLFGLTDAQLNFDLSQLSGQNSTGMQTAAYQATNGFFDLLMNPFADGRVGDTGTGGGAMGYAQDPKPKPSKAALGAFASVFKAPPMAIYQPRWTAWGGAYGGSEKSNGDSILGSTDATSRVFGFGAGLDYHLDPNTVVGLGLAGGNTDWGLSAGLGGGRSDVVQAGVFSRHTMGAWYGALGAAFTDHNAQTDRDVTIAGVTSHYQANFHAQSFGVRAEGGYRFAWQGIGLTPYAAIQTQWLSIPGYSEATTFGPATFALTFASQSLPTTRTELGEWFDYRIMRDMNTQSTLFARVAWAHDSNAGRVTLPTFQTIPGASFVVNGASPSSDLALVTAGAKIGLAKDLSLTGKVNGEFGNASTSYSATGELRKSW